MKFCEELENYLEEAGDEYRILFKKKFLWQERGSRPAFKTVRYVAVFTNKRLSVKDVQGLIWTKVEMYSLPYSAVNMWSTENAGILDYTVEVGLWTRSGHIKVELKRGIDIREFER